MSTSADMRLRGVFWSWEQDGQGGDHGAATFFVGTEREIRVVLPTFKDAFALASSILATIDVERRAARSALLAEIGRIEP